MKKIALFLILAAIVACEKNINTETTNNKVLWTETVQTILPLDRDTLWDEADWNAAYKYDKEKIFSSITNAVLAGKLKAYLDYPKTPFAVEEFNNLLVQWDSTNQVEDVNNPGVFITAPLKRVIVADEIAQLKFNEKIELDTVTYSLVKKISYITFLTYKYSFDGNDLHIIGYKKLFDVKLND